MGKRIKKTKINRERIKSLRLMDDIFMTAVLRDHKEIVELILQTILKKPELKLKSVKVQEVLKNLIGRTTVLDVHAIDTDNNHYDLEFERDSNRATPERVLYHGSLLDSTILPPGSDFNELPERTVIFITEKDLFGFNEPVNKISIQVLVNGKVIPYVPKRQHLLVNGSYDGNNELGQLMFDLNCDNPDEMYNKPIADVVRYYKYNEEGVEKLRSIGEEILNEGIEIGKTQGIEIGKTQGIDEGIEIGQQKERNKNILKIKNNLIHQSGGSLSDEEALKQAELLLS